MTAYRIFQNLRLISQPRCFNSGILSRFQICNHSSFRTKEKQLGLPPKPHSPLVPYMRFLGQLRQNLTPEQKKMRQSELTKTLSQSWHKIDPELRKKLNKEYVEEKKVYIEKMAQYEKSLTEEQREQIRNVKEELIERRERFALQKLKRRLGKPERPMSDFFLFMKEKMEAKEYGDVSNAEYVKRSTEDWRALSEEKKTPYRIRSKEKMDTHKWDLAKWEIRQMEEGKNYFVRRTTLFESAPRPNLTRRPGRPRKIIEIDLTGV